MQMLADIELCKFYLRLCEACADDEANADDDVEMVGSAAALDLG
jgi:hypothetical protein